jgi:hypothetical protein
MPPKNLQQLLAACHPSGLDRERLKQHLCEAGKEFSFTGFSTYFALAKRTLQLVARDGYMSAMEPADRESVLSEPSGIIVREISSMIREVPDFPSAWRFVRRSWEFSEQFQSVIGPMINPDDPVSGPRMQRLLAIANGVPIHLDAKHVPVEFRRER